MDLIYLQVSKNKSKMSKPKLIQQKTSKPIFSGSHNKNHLWSPLFFEFLTTINVVPFIFGIFNKKKLMVAPHSISIFFTKTKHFSFYQAHNENKIKNQTHLYQAQDENKIINQTHLQ